MSSNRQITINVREMIPGKSIEAYSLNFDIDVQSVTDKGNTVRVEAADLHTTLFNSNAFAIISAAARRAADKYGRVSNEFALDNVKRTFNVHCEDCTVRVREETRGA